MKKAQAKYEEARRYVASGNQVDRSRDSLILSDHGPVPLIARKLQARQFK